MRRQQQRPLSPGNEDPNAGACESYLRQNNFHLHETGNLGGHFRSQARTHAWEIIANIIGFANFLLFGARNHTETHTILYYKYFEAF